MRRVLAVMTGVLVAAGIAVPVTAAKDDHHRGHGAREVLRFHTMAPVTEPFTGAAHAVRGVPGGGLPWELRSAHGSLRSDGRLDIDVRGLVLARRDPVPANLQGTNPIPQFRAIVSCLTPAAPDDGAAVQTDPVRASPRGDARIRARVALPSPCVAPVVFVTSPTGQWFAATGA